MLHSRQADEGGLSEHALALACAIETTHRSSNHAEALALPLVAFPTRGR